ncbi:transmembrane protein 272-like [Coccinella septempunctata]|uniref:transmembrane protein 272-like n=1 Tax=Coccinella septempunctata TaxID=41139 RepID=UPI001D0785E7|nr:transmembrane protein 272-like [Coccinella septempunctata]
MAPNASNEGSNPMQRRKQYISSKLKKYLSVSLLVPIIFHIAMIVIGAMNMKKCPVEKNIPIYLLSAGILGIATKILGIGRNFIIKYISFDTIMSIIYTLEFVYFLLGSYWVYKEYKPSFDPMAGNAYCDKTAFMFAFIYITMIYVLMIFFLVLVCCCVAGVVALDKLIPESEYEETPTGPNQQVQSV